jgi:hypothetical protein
MRQGQENNLRFVRELFRISLGKLQGFCFLVMRKTRKYLSKRFAGKLARRDCNKIDMRMREQQADEFFTGVTGRANHRDPGQRFLHNAQCVFRLATIATNNLVGILDRRQD